MSNFSQDNPRFANTGPHDSSDFNAPEDLANFGAISFVPNSLVTVRAEVEIDSQNPVALSFDYKESMLQIQAFASSKGANLWDEIMESMELTLKAQGLDYEKVAGPFGLELVGDVMVSTGNVQKVRMFACSGERWLLRGDMSGLALTDVDQRAELEDIFRGIVINRGETPYPPRERLPLQLPPGAIVPKARL